MMSTCLCQRSRTRLPPRRSFLSTIAGFRVNRAVKCYRFLRIRTADRHGFNSAGCWVLKLLPFI